MRDPALGGLKGVESKRIRNFRLELAKTIPKFPNDRKTLTLLQSVSLNTLFIHYLNWAYRYVSIRPRSVIVESTAYSDPRWKELEPSIGGFLKKVEIGQDLTPHLSTDPHTRGFTPAAPKGSKANDLWKDKDFLLNIMGFHHFHLGQNIDANGIAERTDVILFARVHRDRFIALGLFDHSVFDQEHTPKDTMTKERERLWQLFNEYASRGLAPGSVYVLSPIMTSGHPLHLVRMADNYAYAIRKIDPKLDDLTWVRELYETAGLPRPAKPKLKWCMNFLDLGLFDTDAGSFFILKKGPS